MKPEPDYAEAAKFLTALDPNATRWTFQVFDDDRERKEERKARGEKKDPFAKIIHGTLKQRWSELVKLNAQRAGVFITVNVTNFKGRDAENIEKVRAVFADLDGSPLDPVIAPGEIQPHIVAESSPGRWHAYWRTEGMPRALFAPMQKAIAARYHGDGVVIDLPRVMRLPGFFHCKDEPFRSRIERINDIRSNGHGAVEPYLHCALVAAFQPVLDEPTPTGQSKPKAARWGELNERALKAENLPRWVEKIFPSAKRTRHGGYRVTSADLGRGFEEDLSIDPRGIKYFGIRDMGDKRQGRRTAVELVAEFQQVEAPQAADWLEQTLSGNGQDGDPQVPPPPPEPEPQPEASPAEIEITRLAKGSRIAYEDERVGIAKARGWRVTVLDDLVHAERVRLGLVEPGDDDGMQGRAISFPEPEPYPDPVDGAALFDEIAKTMGAHIIMPEASCDACALWAAHTHLLDCTMISPRLAITSPTRGCGKTTALDVIFQLVLRPLSAANVSASAIFRVVEGYRPCLLIDEADSFLKDNEELRGVLNSGHRKGGAVLRTVGDDHEPRAFSTYGPCAIALIGQLPGTLADRSVPIMLTRRKPDEAITPFRLDKVDHLVELARKLARWTVDNAVTIAATEPAMPAGLYNRAADNWRPLLAIAEVAGGNWPERGQRAALASVAAEVDDASRLELVLGDIRTIFTSKGVDRIASAELVKALAAMEGRPWAEYGRSEKPITPGKLAWLLKPLAIIPENIRVTVRIIDEEGEAKDEEKVLKGYLLERFTEAFTRYLEPEVCAHCKRPGDLVEVSCGGSLAFLHRECIQPYQRAQPEGVSEPLHRYNADKTGTSDHFQAATADPDVADRKCEKPANDGPCSGVAGRKGGEAPAASSRSRAPAFRAIRAAPAGTFCVRCNSAEGEVLKIVSAEAGSKAEPLHLACAAKWFAGEGPAAPDDSDAPPAA